MKCTSLRPFNRYDLRGGVTLEFALLLVPLLFIAFGVIEYSRALYEYNALVKSVRDAARYIAQRSPAESITYSSAVDDTRCLAVHGNTECTGPVLVPGLTTDMVSITPVSSTTAEGTSIALVEVRISGYSFVFAFNPLKLAGDNATVLPFGDIHAAMRQI
jgi:Flp pilus assembly protein TadG